MEDIGIRELKARASEIVRRVMEEREQYVVTHRGRPVAVITPIEENQLEWNDMDEDDNSAWDDIIKLGEQISQNWEGPETPGEILSSMRR